MGKGVSKLSHEQDKSGTVKKGTIDYDWSQIIGYIGEPVITRSTDTRIKTALEELGHEASGIVVWKEKKTEQL